MRYFILHAMIILFSGNLIAQNEIDSLAGIVRGKLGDGVSESVYLQTSKGIYETGEDLWFKVYQLDERSFELSDGSKTLYLQMVGKNDSVVWQEKYPIENGLADGHVYIDENLPEGDYFLEAYTRHSFYDDSTDFCAVRKVRVLKNISSDINNGTKETNQDLNFRFETFPEGGNLVSGLSSQLAFKATDGSGNPVDVKGALFQYDVAIAEFESVYYGMGSFAFIPIAGQKYKIELADGRTFSLPEIYSEGMTLRLSDQNREYLEFIVSQPNGLAMQEIYLVGQLRGMICCVAKAILKNDQMIKIPVKEFPYQGIAGFTLFNSAMQPVAERLVYVNPEKKLHVTIEPDKKSYKIREKAVLKIKVTDDEGNPVRANLGVSVFDKAYHNPSDPVNIFTYYYLSSQIRGKIYDPEYYFDKENEDRLQAMDLLLLTQGWRRYVWDMADPVCHGDLFLSDEVIGKQTVGKKKKAEKLESEQLIQLSSPDGNATFVWADSSGNFSIDPNIMKNFRGGYLYLKPMLTASEYKPTLEIENLFPAIDSVRRKKQCYYPLTDLIQSKKELRLNYPVVSSDSTISLDEVTITGKGRRPYRDKLMGRLDSLAQMDFGPYVCEHGHLENYMDGFTAHHDPRYCPCAEAPKERNLPIIGKTYRIIKPKYHDCGGHCCFTVEEERNVVYEGPNYSEEELLRRNNYWRTKGYYGVREFYKPDEIDMQMSIPDARNTLLWEPNVITDDKGEATVTFYCSDINTEFIGKLEGVDGLGLIGSANCEFRVIRF